MHFNIYESMKKRFAFLVERMHIAFSIIYINGILHFSNVCAIVYQADKTADLTRLVFIK